MALGICGARCKGFAGSDCGCGGGQTGHARGWRGGGGSKAPSNLADTCAVSESTLWHSACAEYALWSSASIIPSESTSATSTCLPPPLVR